MIAAALAGTLLAADPACAQSFAVVVNERNPVTVISREELSGLFLKKVQWAGRLTAVPVDLRNDSPIRADFTTTIHRRPLDAITAYWRTKIFSDGVAPPPVKRSDAEVLNFVRANAGAIGYVSAFTDVGAGVKIVTITEE